ncbi:MCP four helix bundle domain-containing protein [Clostridium novyi]|uniref:MCP four helix bundle domain-containing protein n=1 Tax=Clostridium novyi TaxID=1542 RepID=UPI00068EB8E9|nr:MCP four helix bundle domain-containing protein [Clostridium novyi]
MKFLKDITIKKKLIFSFLILILLMSITGLFAINSGKKINDNAEKMYWESISSIKNLDNIKLNIEKEKGCIVRLLFDPTEDSSDKQYIRKFIEVDIEDDNEKLMKEYEKVKSTEIEKKYYDEFKGKINQYKTIRRKAFKLIIENNQGGAVEVYVKEIKPLGKEMSYVIDKISNKRLQSVKLDYLQNKELFSKVKITLTSLIVLGIIIAIFLAFGILKDVNDIS